VNRRVTAEDGIRWRTTWNTRPFDLMDFELRS
jgi:hypothetical protein